MIDVRDQIAQHFIAALNAGTIPWRKPWAGTSARPRSGATGRPYRGVNALLLGMLATMRNYGTGEWYTFNGAKKAGGCVRKGEKGTAVMFWKFIKTADKATGRDKTIPLCRSFTVFNRDQCDNLPPVKVDVRENSPIHAAEMIVKNMKNPPVLCIRQSDSAHYVPSTDTVVIPNMSQFHSAADFYATVFHELAHSTGHTSRLDRKLDGTFGTDPYSREELVAEITSAFLSAEAGTLDQVQDNNTAYVQNWASRLSKDPRTIIEAASLAQKAADYILGTTFEEASED